MKNNILSKFVNSTYATIFVIVSSIALLQSCSRDLGFSYQVADRKLLMFDQIKADTNFSIFVEGLEKTNLSSVLNSYGPYTVFAPNNTGFRKYFALKGKSGLSAFALDTLANILRYHIVPAKPGDGALYAANFIQGPQATASSSGDLINIDISNGFKSTAVANATALIYSTDNEYYNGLLHKMDGVLDPPIQTIGEFLLSNPSTYSIITSGLQRAGLMDTLTKLNNPLGVRTRITLFAETNDVLRANGVTDYNGYSQDSLVKYMRNHLVAGAGGRKSYTRNNTAIAQLGLKDRWDTTLATLDGEDWIYLDLAAPRLINGTTDFTVSDLSMRNGLIHNVSKPLTFTNNKRTQIYHQCWAYPAFCYGPAGFAPGASPVANVSSGNFRWYYDGGVYNGTTITNLLFMLPASINDSLVMVVSGVKRGKYEIRVSGKGGGTRGTYQVNFGADSITTYNFNYPGAPGNFRQNALLGTYDFKTSGNKRLKLIAKNTSGINLECFVFTPVN